MTQSQWFFAHSKQDDPIEIDEWCQELAVALSGDGWDAVVISGRDDYENRSAALGGWKAWCRDVPCGIDYTGAPLYHGVIVPVDSVEENPTVGKATAQILQGFIDQSKHVYAWCPDSKSFRQVSLIEPLDNDSWVSWARLEFTP
tara:strand:+ start:13463 stop:13894 length:432 start_codon:yes stop_codon:yes gene_type:complete